MIHFDIHAQQFVGSAGVLPVPAQDEISRKLAMLLEGECANLGPLRAAQKFGLSKQRYFQLRQVYRSQGALALCSQKRGPKRNYRRNDEVVRQIVRHRFLDPDASAAVIAQQLRQTGWTISTRSVERVINSFGLQKKLYRCRPSAEETMPTRRSRTQTRIEPCDPTSLERAVRQLLSDKVSSTALGLWLLVPEHLLSTA